MHESEQQMWETKSIIHDSYACPFYGDYDPGINPITGKCSGFIPHSSYDYNVAMKEYCTDCPVRGFDISSCTIYYKLKGENIMFEPEVIKKLLNPRNLESLKLSKVDLEAMELYEDLGGKFTRYLYRCKAENGQEWLVEIPKTSCPVKTNELPNFDTYPEWSTSIPEPKTSMDTVGRTFLHLGTPKYIKLTNKYQQEAIVVKVIKEPIKDMTLAEVEEKLGYKVKIISGENKN